MLYLARLLLVGGLVGLVVVIGGLTQHGVDDYLRPARALPNRSPAALGLAYRDAPLVTDDGLHLAGWYLPGRRRQSLVLVHGLGANRADLLDLAADLHARGYALLLLDLRAHGQSEGAVSTLGVKEVRDIRAAVRFLQTRAELDPHQIGIYGASLGGAVALLAAAALPDLRAVAVDSTFASARWVVDHQLQALLNLPDWFGGLLLTLGGWEAGIVPDEASPMLAASRLGPRPLLVVHGTQDQLFRVDNAQLIYAAASGPRQLWLLDGVGHTGAYGQNRAAYVARLDAFFSAAAATTTS